MNPLRWFQAYRDMEAKVLACEDERIAASDQVRRLTAENERLQSAMLDLNAAHKADLRRFTDWQARRNGLPPIFSEIDPILDAPKPRRETGRKASSCPLGMTLAFGMRPRIPINFRPSPW